MTEVMINMADHVFVEREGRIDTVRVWMKAASRAQLRRLPLNSKILFDELGLTFKPDLRDDLIDEAVERLHVFNRDLEM